MKTNSTSSGRYRPVLSKNDVRVRGLVQEICLTNELQILKGHILKDRVHPFLSMSSSLSASKLIQNVKGKTY